MFLLHCIYLFLDGDKLEDIVASFVLRVLFLYNTLLSDSDQLLLCLLPFLCTFFFKIEKYRVLLRMEVRCFVVFLKKKKEYIFFFKKETTLSFFWRGEDIMVFVFNESKVHYLFFFSQTILTRWHLWSSLPPLAPESEAPCFVISNKQCCSKFQPTRSPLSPWR